MYCVMVCVVEFEFRFEVVFESFLLVVGGGVFVCLWLFDCCFW